jgi:uncharacterized protein (UPF0264 family)
VTWRGLLVSVRDAAEALEALEGGASIIDVKEPRRGPLGMADPVAAAAVARVVGRHVPWTMACGELADMEAAVAADRSGNQLVRVMDMLDGPAVPPAALKIGLASAAGTPWEDRLRIIWDMLPVGPERVAVAYADWREASAPPPEDVIAAAAALGCRTLLVDTFDKSAPGLFGCCPAASPAAWVAAARAAGMRVAIAGRIAMEQIPRAWSLGPDVVAVRSAVCFNGREGTVRADLVRRAVGIGPAALMAAADQAPSSGVRT